MGKLKSDSIPWRFMAPLMLGTMLNPLNSTMLATALTTLCNSFKVTTGQGSILITALYMTSTVAQPLMGRLSDIYNAKQVNAAGFLLIIVAALLGAFAPAFGWLIVSRIILGLGTSAAYPSAIALINKKYAIEGKTIPGPVLGLIAICGQVSMVLGPTLGGFLTQAFGWRGIFLVNIPFVILGLFLSGVLPSSANKKAGNFYQVLKQLDAIGILIFTFFLLALLAVLTPGNLIYVKLVLCISLLTVLILWERRHQSPFIDVRLLVNQPLLAMVYVRGIITSYVLYLVLYGFPQWIEGVRHMVPVETGLIMLPNTLAAIFLGILVSRIKKSNLQNLLGVGILVFVSIGFYLLDGHVPIWFVILIGILSGAAEGVNLVANQTLLNEKAPIEQKGVSFGLYRTAAYIGAILSGTQLKHLFAQGVTDHHFHLISIFMSISCILLILLLVPLFVKKASKK